MLAVLLAVGLGCSSWADPCNDWKADFTRRLSVHAEKLPACLERFKDYLTNASSDRFVVSTNFWLKGLDFTAVSPWNSHDGNLRAGTAISRRHVIFAKHFPLRLGTRIAFVGETGIATHYTIKDVKAVASCDIMVGVLDWELTPDIHPAKILPEISDGLFAPGSYWPVVTFDKHERAYLSEIVGNRDEDTGVLYLINRAAHSNEWRRYGGHLVCGDSGNPAFIILNGQPILLYCLLGGGEGDGPFIHKHRTEVQKVMDELCSGYKLEEASIGHLGPSEQTTAAARMSSPLP